MNEQPTTAKKTVPPTTFRPSKVAREKIVSIAAKKGCSKSYVMKRLIEKGLEVYEQQNDL